MELVVSGGFKDHISRVPMCHNYWTKMQCCLTYGSGNTRQIMLWNLSEKDVNFLNAMFEDLIEDEDEQLYGIREYIHEGTVVCDLRIENEEEFQDEISFMAYIQVMVYGIRERFNRLSPLFYVSHIDKID